MKIDLDGIWKKHRRFLVQTAGGGALFLILVWMASGYADVSEDVEANARRAASLEQGYRNLNLNYWRTVGQKSALEKRLKDLVADLSIRTESSIQVPANDLGVEFKTRKDEVYTEFIDRANRIGLRCPLQKDINFDEGSDLSPEEWADRYRQLEVLRRVLNHCVAPGIHAIEAIRPGVVASESLSGSGATDQVLWRYPVQFEIVLGYAACASFFETFQKDGKYLAVEIQELKPIPEHGPGRLRGVIQFVGIDIGEPRAEKKGPKGFRRQGPR